MSCNTYNCADTNDNTAEKINLIKSSIGTVPDFPKPGIIFKDIFALMKNPVAFHALKDVLIEHVKSFNPPVQAVAGLDARGFLLAPIIALHFNIPLIPIRKKGKLPGKVHSISYELEYGTDTVEVQENDLPSGTRILIVDDLIATGGSLKAGCELLKKVGFEIVQCLVIIELKDLNGRVKIPFPVHSILEF